MKKIIFILLFGLIIFSFQKSETTLQIWDKLKSGSVNTGGNKNMGFVNENISIDKAWESLRLGSDASYDGTKITDKKNNVYFKYKNSKLTTETLGGKGYSVIGTISISSGPNASQKIRFTK